MRKGLTVFMLVTFLILVQATFVWAKMDTDSVDIVIDLTPPEINISGVIDGEKYSSPISPVVSAQDNSGEVMVTTDIKRFGAAAVWLSGQEISNYGTYTLIISAADRAGNKTGKTVSFTLTTYAGLPTISINKEQYIAGDVMTVTVTDLNRIGQGSIEVNAYGVQGNPKIDCRETAPGTFVGTHSFIKQLLSGGFYVRYDYDVKNKKYVEAQGHYVVSANNDGDSSENITAENTLPNELPTDLPGTVIGVVEGNETQAPPGDTAFFETGSNGQYEYVPSIYNPVSGEYRILGRRGKYIMVALPGSLNQSWASPANDWFKQRGIAPPPGELITTKDVMRVAARATGINAGISGSTVVTPTQMEQILNNMVKASPVQANQSEINKWANERRHLSKPLTKSEVIVTMYWSLQKANMAK